ncbi:unnamed protein product, partial [Prunus brigantina]
RPHLSFQKHSAAFIISRAPDRITSSRFGRTFSTAWPLSQLRKHPAATPTRSPVVLSQTPASNGCPAAPSTLARSILVPGWISTTPKSSSSAAYEPGKRP